jgi:GTP cyclohydrolase IA
MKKRRNSLSKAARDPRDKASPVEPDVSTRSPSPVIDFDGLIKPSKFYAPINDLPLTKPSRGTRERLEESPEQAADRLAKISDAVLTILECIREDPSREGLLGTPERYSRAMLFFTKGYQENVRDIVNDAIFHDGHNELVIVKDIEVFSLCEHHMVPFTGKVGV